jgi:ribose transport system ATP-binding protein
MRGISRAFGATLALDGVELSLAAGEVHAVIGENGAGKSTLMKILSGAVRPDHGEMWLDGEPYRPADPHAARRSGVAMIYQELTLAPHLSVEQNLMLGVEQSRRGRLQHAAMRERAREVLGELGRPDLAPEAVVGRLGVGAQQLVEVGRALVTEARVIVFDEPTSSLTGHDVEHLFGLIRRLTAQGVSVLYVSHFLEEVRRVADRYTVLRDGLVAGSGAVAEVDSGQLVAMMVGRELEEMFPRVPHQPGAVVLRLEELTGSPSPRGVDLALRRGEILGLAGLVGAGRTELVRSVFGLEPVRAGRVSVATLSGTTSDSGAPPWRRLAQGIAMLSEDRKAEGLALPMSVADNVTLSDLGACGRWGVLNLARQRAAARRWIEALGIRTAGPSQAVWNLSGGNQQRVAFARLLHHGADVLLLDEPTRGIDVGAKAQIFRLMGELAAEGKAILFISSYLPELMGVCDRIGVMNRGRLVEIRPVGEWEEHTVMTAATGAEA